MRTPSTLRGHFARLLVLSCAFLAAGCGGEDPVEPNTGPEPFTYDDPWPADADALLTAVFEDGAGDQEAMPPEQAGPPYSEIVPWPAVDVTRISLGMDADYLYMRVDHHGPIPDRRARIAPDGEVEEQWVGNQGMNIALNVDGDRGTGGGGEGVDGIDVFFATGFDYGGESRAYCNYGFPDGDLHFAQGQVIGEVGEGGQGASYVIVRYDVSGLGEYFPRGATVEIGSWSEAESFDAAGDLLYHHFAFDRVIDGLTWTIPE